MDHTPLDDRTWRAPGHAAENGDAFGDRVDQRPHGAETPTGTPFKRFMASRSGTSGHMTDFNTDTSNQQADEFTEPSAGPVPTPAEERAADRSKNGVDLDQVDEHYQEMNAKGAQAKGEGRIS